MIFCGARLFEDYEHGSPHLASRSHFSAASLAIPQASDSASGNRVMWTLSGSLFGFGRYFQISSEVKTRIGAAKRTRALLILQTAVCAGAALNHFWEHLGVKAIL